MRRLRRWGIRSFAAGWLLAVPSAALDAQQSRPLDVQLAKLDGGKERLSESRGRRLLLELWATWCAPCVEQAEVVRGAADELTHLGIEVLAVNVGEGRDVVARSVAENPPHGRCLLDRGQRIARQLGITRLPALVAITEDGEVIAVREGLVTDDELRDLLAGAFGDSPPVGPVADGVERERGGRWRPRESRP